MTARTRTSSKPNRSKNAPAPIERGSGGQANADRAADSAPGDRKPGEDLKARQEKLIDEALEETFPASDSISPKRVS